MQKPSFPISVIMQRRTLQNRWVDHMWEPIGVLPESAGEGAPRKLVDEDGLQQWLHPGFRLVLHRDECEGYYLNVSAPAPRVFILWRAEEAGPPVPVDVTVSSEEGGRWLDGGHAVDGVPMPPEIFAWVGDYVEKNYRPEPKKRIKPRSFMHPKDRAAR